MTPARFVELVRLDRAKQLLETTRWPLARVASRSRLRSAQRSRGRSAVGLGSRRRTIGSDFELPATAGSGSADRHRILLDVTRDAAFYC
jgi:hypothetical protein